MDRSLPGMRVCFPFILLISNQTGSNKNLRMQLTKLKHLEYFRFSLLCYYGFTVTGESNYNIFENIILFSCEQFSQCKKYFKLPLSPKCDEYIVVAIATQSHILPLRCPIRFFCLNRSEQQHVEVPTFQNSTDKSYAHRFNSCCHPCDQLSPFEATQL